MSKEYLNLIRKHHELDNIVDDIQRDGHKILTDSDKRLLHDLKKKRLALRDRILKIEEQNS